LNTPKAVLIALVLILVINGFLFDRYRSSLIVATSPSQVTRVATVAKPAEKAEAPAAAPNPADGEVNEVAKTNSEEAGGKDKAGEAKSDAANPQESKEVALTTQPAAPTRENPSRNQQVSSEEVLRVSVRVTEAPSWLSIQTDDTLAYEEIAQPGFSRTFEGQDSISIRTGNAGSVEVETNRENLGTLGADGEVLTRTFTVESEGG
jgi:uncharacterized protein DUF4115